MSMHENMLTLSTANVQLAPRPKRYQSAAHALGCYFEYIEQIHGAPGLDPERMGMQVQCSPSKQNPYLDRIDDVRNLAAAFAYAERRAQPDCWRVWRAHRVKLKPLGKIRGFTKTSAHRYVHIVDSFIEAWLAKNDLLAFDMGD